MPKMLRMLVVLARLCTVFCLGGFVDAQVEGNNAISKDSSGNIAGSAAYIDAAPFYNGGGLDICQVLNNILSCSTTHCTTGYVVYPANGAVVDARGILPTLVNNSYPPLTCSVDPFTGVSAPSTILLPATSIQTATTWTLPSNTRLIGEGPGHNNYTEVQIELTGFTGTSMVQITAVQIRGLTSGRFRRCRRG